MPIENTKAENTRRIAKNTLLLYGRMLFGMVVSLYTSRVVLNTLGVEDYGIYNVVGGFVAMFSLISSSLSSSVSRFITFELGKGNPEKLKRVFSTSLLIHLTLIAVIVIVAETVGVWFVNNKMTIPEDRMYAANWVFQASIVSFCIRLLSVTYNATIIAHERMNAYAYIGVLDILLKLAIVLFIAYSSLRFDRLIVYALLLVVVGIVIQLIYISYSRKHFNESHVNLCFYKDCWKEMGAFAGWNFIGCTAGILKDQGVNILLNLFIGPVVNAARGISVSVNSAVSGFAGNFMSAINPQITKSYASGDRSYMMSLVERGSKFSFYILLLLSLPIILETEFILTLWLKQYPNHAVNFVRLVLILSMVDILSNTLITLQLATGKIRNYQIAVGGVLLMNFPISYICLKVGLPPESTYVVAILVAILCLLLRLIFLKRIAGLDIRQYLKNVCFNVIVVAVVSSICPLICHCYISEGWLRLFLELVVGTITSCFAIYFIGCTHNERKFIYERIIAFFERLRK